MVSGDFWVSRLGCWAVALRAQNRIATTADWIRFIVHPLRNFFLTCDLRWPFVECCSFQDTAAVDVNTSERLERDPDKNLARGGIWVHVARRPGGQVEIFAREGAQRRRWKASRGRRTIWMILGSRWRLRSSLRNQR